jgi:diaminopimelate epimerase
MSTHFWKMHGAGNDFVLFDDRSRSFATSDTAGIARLCHRRTGVGGDGVILIQPSDKADISMRFFNPDGREAEMCGNGARCLARLASEIGAAPPRMTIATGAGIVKAEMVGRDVRLQMTTPRDWRLNKSLQVNGQTLTFGFVNSGVPHAVIDVPDLDACDVAGLGAAIRYHKEFAPSGTNVNFVKVAGPQSLRVRTYERGVEAETLACGTGIVATALVAARMNRVKPPVGVTAAGGDVLTVNFDSVETGAENVTLLGPAVHVFEGDIPHPLGD